MYWYSISKTKDGYVVWKNVENHGIGSRGVFRGTKTECINYCKKKNIKLNVKKKVAV